MANAQPPLLGALGLCRKAGKLLHGYDRVQENALRGKVALVLLTADTVRETAFSDFTIAACEALMTARERRKPWKQQKKGPPDATGRPLREHPAARQRTDPAPKVKHAAGAVPRPGSGRRPSF